MTTYLILKHIMTLKKGTRTQDTKSGQMKTTFDSGTQYKCEFLYLATENKHDLVLEDEDIIEIIVADDVTPSYNDQISNIVDRYGNVIEAGPLEIIGIKKYAGFAGKLHHYRIRTRRLRKAC